jgi:guanyl-specific ribonuclease Sa
MIRGLTLGQQTTRQVYEPPGSMLGQVAGLGVGLGGMARFGQMFADGGEVKEYAEGGGVDSPGNIAKIVDKLSDEQLVQAEEAARARGDFAQVQAIIAERGMRASERSGMAGMFNSLPQEAQEAVTEMASGGIVAFAGPSEDNNYSLVEDPQFGGSSAGVADMDQLRIESERARRAALEEEARMRFLRESAPEVHQRIMAGRPSAPVQAAPAQAAPAQAPRAAQAAPQPARRDEPRRAATITRQEARRAVETIAQGNNVEIPKDDTKELTEQFMKEFSAKSASERAEVKADLEKAKSRAKEIEARGIGEAMMRFGFGMAAAASKPGAGTGLGGALRSAAAASPIFAESLAETNKLKQAAEDNYTKLRMENRRYENALDQGNMQLASSLANNINQRKLAQANLERQIVQQDRMFDLEKQKADFARSQAGRPGSSLEMAYNVLRADPKNKDKSNSDVLEEAARRAGSVSSYRTDTTALIQAEKMKKDLMDKRRMFAGTDSKFAREQVRLIDEDIRRIDAGLGLRGGVGSGTTTGWSIEPVAGGR